MKALTVTQPWASLIARGVKTIETRHWATSYRGPLAIHAASGFASLRQSSYRGTLNGMQDLVRDSPALRRACEAASDGPGGTLTSPWADDHLHLVPVTCVLGKIVAVCRLADCIKITPSWLASNAVALNFQTNEWASGNYTPGRYAWILKDVTQVEPVSPRDENGTHPFAQGLWHLPDPVVGKLRAWVPSR